MAPTFTSLQAFFFFGVSLIVALAYLTLYTLKRSLSGLKMLAPVLLGSMSPAITTTRSLECVLLSLPFFCVCLILALILYVKGPTRHLPLLCVVSRLSSSSIGMGSGKRGRENDKDLGFGYKELAQAMERFGEINEKVEATKHKQMVELERQRMQFAKDLEYRRM